MMNCKRLAALGLGMILCLSACGGSEESGRGRKEEAEEETEKETPSEAPEKNEKDSETVPADPQPTAAAGVFSEAFANGDVENNGENFVRIGDQIYYRIYSVRSLHRTALFGTFIDADIPTAPSTLVAYDRQTNRKTELYTVYGSGKLYAGTEGFFLANSETNETWRIPMDGSEQSLYCKGTPNGVSADGRILEVTQYDFDAGFYGEVLVCEGKEIAQFSNDGMDGVFFCGFAGNDAVFVARPEGEENWSLYSIDEAGTKTELGQIDPGTDDEWISYLFPEPEQLLYDEEGAYLTFGYYDGTGHMLANWVALSVKPGVAGSLQMLEAENRADNIDADLVPHMLLTGPGEVELYRFAGGEVGLSEDYYGDLVYYDSPYGATILKKNFISKEESDGSAGGKNFLLDAAVFDDTAFVITAYGTRNERYDVGWREAYDLIYLEISDIPFDAAHLEDGAASEMISLEFLTSTAWGETIDDYDDLVGTWILDYYETEGYSGYASDDGLDTKLIFDADGSVRLEQKADGKLQTLELTPDEGDEEDKEGVYVYFTNDGIGDDVMQLDLITCDDTSLEVSVSWWYSDGVPGGSTWVFLKEE